MRFLAFLALLLTGAAAVWHFGFRGDEPAPFVGEPTEKGPAIARGAFPVSLRLTPEI